MRALSGSGRDPESGEGRDSRYGAQRRRDRVVAQAREAVPHGPARLLEPASAHGRENGGGNGGGAERAERGYGLGRRVVVDGGPLPALVLGLVRELDEQGLGGRGKDLAVERANGGLGFRVLVEPHETHPPADSRGFS